MSELASLSQWSTLEKCGGTSFTAAPNIHSNMSHSVTITRTTTTTTSTAIILNSGYLKTLPGLLKLIEALLGAVIVGIIGYYINRYGYGHYYFNTYVLFLLLMATAFMITTFLMWLSSLMSFATASMIPKTLFEVQYHGIAFILYLVASIIFLVEVKELQRYSHYNAYLAAAIIGLINAALYLISTVLGIRSYRGIGI